VERFEKAFGEWMIRLRWWILLLTPLLVLGVASGIQQLSFTTNYRVFFSPENPQLNAFEQLEKTYTQDDNVIFLLIPEQGDVFTNRVLEAVEWLTRESWQLPYSIRVDSLTNFQHTEARGDELIVRNLAENSAELAPAELERIRTVALHEPLLVNKLVPKKGDVTLVIITVQFPRQDEGREVPAVMDAAQDLQARMQARYPEIKIHLSGMAPMNATFTESSLNDLKGLVPISFAIMLVVLGLLLRSIYGVLATALVILMSIAVALGAAGHLGYPITPPSAVAPNLILTIAIASSVHVLVTFYQELRRTSGRKGAIVESLRVNLQPVFLTSLTTTIGFLSLNFSEVPPFRHMANIVAVGVVASFVLSVSFLPALMTLLPARVSHSKDLGQRLMERLGEWVGHHRSQLLAATGVLVVLLVSFVPLNQLNDVYVRYFDHSIDFRNATDELDRHLGGLYRIDYSLNTGESNGISDPQFLRQAEAFTEWLREQPEVVQVTSITDTFKRLNRNLHGDDPAWHRLPESRELAAQYLLLYEMSLPYGLDLNNQIDVDKSATRITMAMHVLSTQQVLELERRAGAWLEANAPHLHTEGASPTIMFAHIGYRNIRSMLVGTTLALVLISLILVAALRSVKIGMISMIPNLVPAAMGFGIWGLLVGEVGLSLSIVTGMTLGIVVDDTVHFLSKYLRARREEGLDAPGAVRYAFDRVGMALLITTLVLMAGFLVLALSSFYLNSGMGLLTAIILGLALLADFLFLPPLLIWVDERLGRRPAEAVTAVSKG